MGACRAPPGPGVVSLPDRVPEGKPGHEFWGTSLAGKFSFGRGGLFFKKKGWNGDFGGDQPFQSPFGGGCQGARTNRLRDGGVLRAVAEMFGDTGETANAGFWLEYLQEQGVKTVKRTKEVMQRALAFTLVELLVVIAILGLLAGLSIPAIQSSRAKAGLAASMANLKQIHVMIQTYVADNNNNYPPFVGDGNVKSWRRLIWENSFGEFNPGREKTEMASTGYTKVMWCPYLAGKYGKEEHEEGRGSYGMNSFFYPPSWGGKTRNAVQAEVIGKVEPYLFSGKPFDTNKKYGTLYHTESTSYPYTTFWSSLAFEYGGVGVGLFVDGHTESITKTRGNQINEKISNWDTFE